MRTTSDGSRGNEHHGSRIPFRITTEPYLSNLALTVDQISRTLDLGNPVSCWSRQAALFLAQSPISLDENLFPEPVQRGAHEALNQIDLPQTMVGTILQMSLLFEQLIDELSTDQDPQKVQRFANRYRQVADANLITIPWHAVIDSRTMAAEVREHLATLLETPSVLAVSMSRVFTGEGVH